MLLYLRLLIHMEPFSLRPGNFFIFVFGATNVFRYKEADAALGKPICLEI